VIPDREHPDKAIANDDRLQREVRSIELFPDALHLRRGGVLRVDEHVLGIERHTA
jgi:hypothetical protein